MAGAPGQALSVPGALHDRVADIEASIGRRDWDRVASMVADDLVYRVGGAPARHGLSGLRAYMEAQARIVEWTGHDEVLCVATDDTLVIEVVSHFRRLSDGADLRLPCTDIYRFRDGRLADWRVYADLAAIGLRGDLGVDGKNKGPAEN